MKRSLISIFSIVASLESAAFGMPVEFERDTNLPIINLSIVLKTGAVSDPTGQYGITNFLGELMVRGTKTRTKEQIDLEMDQMGAQFDIETRSEMTIFRGSVLSSQKTRFLALIREILTDPSFPEAEIRKLKKEITSSILEALGRDSSLAGHRFTEVLFNAHPYAKPVLGRKIDIENLTADKLREHYLKWFQDQNLFIVGSGDGKASEIEEFANQIRSRLSVGQKNDFILSTPVQSVNKKYVIIDKPDRTQVQIQVGQIGIKFDHPDYFALSLVNHTFGGGGFSSRLMQEIRVKRGWSYGSGSHFRQGTQPRSWQYSLFPASKYAVDALKTTFDMVKMLKEKGLTESEFDFSKQSSINSAEFGYNTPQKRSENRVLELALGLPKGFMENTALELKKVSLVQANSAAKNFFKADQLVVVIVGTAKDLVPAMKDKLGIPENDIQIYPYTQEL